MACASFRYGARKRESRLYKYPLALNVLSRFSAPEQSVCFLFAHRLLNPSLLPACLTMAKKGKKPLPKKNASSAGVQKSKKIVPGGKWVCEVCDSNPMNKDPGTVNRHLGSYRHLQKASQAGAEQRPRAPLVCKGCKKIFRSGRIDSLHRHQDNCQPWKALPPEPEEEMPVAGPSRLSPSPPVAGPSGRLPSPPVAGPSRRLSSPPIAGPSGRIHSPAPVAGRSQRAPSPPAAVQDFTWPVFALERDVAPPPQVLQEPVVFPPPVFVAERVQGPNFDIPAAPAWDPFAMPEYDAEGAFTRHLLGDDDWDFSGW
ncbi:hypothetical protein B0H21DRAFT_724263 [Amylocystis lapponica]|nr:hypothetical protein B0H21DRAFT_724263 [Amylocystis lapponica]